MSETTEERGIKFQWTGMTHPGRFRKNNEDAFLALTFNAGEVQYLGKEGESPMAANDFIFAVSDGMGGANAGEFASRIAVQKITELLPKNFRQMPVDATESYSAVLTKLVQDIHYEMRQMGRHYEECRGMGATLSMAWFTPTRLYFAHVGDSRLYYLPEGGKMQQLTQDHTHVGWLVRQGQLTAAQARHHPQKSLLQRALGGKVKTVEPDVSWVDFQAGDCFLLCTDGVTDSLSDRVIDDMVRAPSARLKKWVPAQRVVQEAMDGASRDNCTAVVVEVR